MRLVKLFANKPSFKTVVFNKKGPSFILAKQQKPEKANKGTYNGVGKSLIIYLIHFCLGANKVDSFSKNLSGWVFSLEFSHNKKSYTVTRSTDKQGEVFVNCKKYSQKSVREFLLDLCFTVPENSNNLTWRTLFPHFVRQKRDAYIDFDNAGNEKQPFQRQINNSLLLGLDTNLVMKKYELNKQLKNTEELRKNFEKDELIRTFLGGNKEVGLEILELNAQISELSNHLQKYEVAKDYYDVKQDADTLEKKISAAENKAMLLKLQIERIDESLEVSADLSKDKIVSLYEEAIGVLPSKINKRLDDLERFFSQLSANRITRLTSQKVSIQHSLVALEKEIQKDRKTLDSKLQYIGAHDSLDIFVKLSTRLGDIKSQLKKLHDYNDLLDQYKRTISELRIEITQENLHTDQYLQKVSNYLRVDQSYFRELAKRFYPNSTAGISVKSNDGENMLRFTFDAHIDSDGSDGINNVKIFCYDLTVLKARHNHNVDFIFHDSRIFDGVEDRQISDMVELINETFVEQQYIASINEYHVKLIESIIGVERTKELIYDNTVLNLTDDSNTGKLLGLQVDLKLG